MADLVKSLFPYGKSGLKFLGNGVTLEDAASLPVWEEWIEIGSSPASAPCICVSSRMGRVD